MSAEKEHKQSGREGEPGGEGREKESMRNE